MLVKRCGRRKLVGVILGVVSIVLPSCSAQSTSPTTNFESLVTLIEKGEATLESGIAMYEPAVVSFMTCLNENPSFVYLCESKRDKAVKQFDMAIALFDFQKLKSELQALRLTDNAEASQARDAFVKHLRAWRDRTERLRYAIPSADALARQDLSFADTWVEIIETSRVTETFDDACSGLGNGQPANSDEFTARIIDICND